MILTAIGFCIIAISSWMLFQGKIPLLKYAYISLYSAPLYFLPGVLLYLYIKSVVGKHKNLRIVDALHLIPALINTIMLIPYFNLPYQDKQNAILYFLLETPEKAKANIFMISSEGDTAIKISVWFIYLIATIAMLIRFRKTNSQWIETRHHIWLWVTKTTMITTVALGLYVALVIDNYDIQSFAKLLVLPLIFLTLTCISVVMFYPQVLYGLAELRLGGANDDHLSRSLELPTSKIEEYKGCIENLIEKEQIFLVRNYSIKDMSTALDIPLHHLSYVINNNYGTNFKNFINNYRIDYIIKNRFRDEWINYTLEGIGHEAGFNSRNTFFKAFKIATGKTPAEYFKGNPLEEPQSASLR